MLSDLFECYSLLCRLILPSGDVEIIPDPSKVARAGNTTKCTMQNAPMNMLKRLQKLNDEYRNIQMTKWEPISSVNKVNKEGISHFEYR